MRKRQTDRACPAIMAEDAPIEGISAMQHAPSIKAKLSRRAGRLAEKKRVAVLANFGKPYKE